MSKIDLDPLAYLVESEEPEQLNEAMSYDQAYKKFDEIRELRDSAAKRLAQIADGIERYVNPPWGEDTMMDWEIYAEKGDTRTIKEMERELMDAYMRFLDVGKQLDSLERTVKKR